MGAFVKGDVVVAPFPFSDGVARPEALRRAWCVSRRTRATLIEDSGRATRPDFFNGLLGETPIVGGIDVGESDQTD